MQLQQQMGGMGGGLGGMGGFGGMGGLGGMGGFGGFGQQPQQQGDPKEIYKSQLEQLKNMGFTNENVNIEALKASGGNVEVAVERLLNMMPWSHSLSLFIWNLQNLYLKFGQIINPSIKNQYNWNKKIIRKIQLKLPLRPMFSLINHPL